MVSPSTDLDLFEDPIERPGSNEANQDEARIEAKFVYSNFQCRFCSQAETVCRRPS